MRLKEPNVLLQRLSTEIIEKRHRRAVAPHDISFCGNILILSTVVSVTASVSMSLRVSGEVYVWKC